MKQPRAFDLIAFDADDTLWHNERAYRDSRQRFREILAAAGIVLTEDEVEAHINESEVRNLSLYGYGVSNFVLSLIETAIGLSDGRIPARHIEEIIDLARRMITSEVELFPYAESTLRALARRYPLMLITKGDLLHQRSKLTRSGLEQYFQFVEVVSHKTPEVYAAILARHRVEPTRFLMIGNSLRSDILPVVEIGGRAVHIPAELTWTHEHADPTSAMRRRYLERESLEHIAVFVEEFEREISTARAGRRIGGKAATQRPRRGAAARARRR
jgi:putative hydrolase of the HAD superfamily